MHKIILGHNSRIFLVRIAGFLTQSRYGLMSFYEDSKKYMNITYDLTILIKKQSSEGYDDQITLLRCLHKRSPAAASSNLLLFIRYFDMQKLYSSKVIKFVLIKTNLLFCLGLFKFVLISTNLITLDE